MGKRCFYFTPAVGCFLLVVLGVYGIAGIIFNIKELYNDKNFHRGNWPLNHRPAYLSLTFAQAGITIASILGIIATIYKAILIFYVSAFILLGIFASMIIVGGVCLRDASKDLSHLIFNSLQNGSTEDYEWISYIQWEYNCCGVHSFMDWNLFNMTGLPQYSVPSSCCQRTIHVPTKYCGKGILIPNKKIEDIYQIINKEGCGEKLALYHKLSLNYAGIEMLALGIVCLVVATFLYIAITKTLYLDLIEDEDPENTTMSQESISNTNNNNNNNNNNTSDSIGDCRTVAGSLVRFTDINGNVTTTGAHSNNNKDPSFKSSQLLKNKVGNGSGKYGQGTPFQSGKIDTKKRSGRFRFQKNKKPRHPSTIPIPMVTQMTVSPEPLIQKKVEMLYDPVDKLDKYSSLSTTPNQSISQFTNRGENELGESGHTNIVGKTVLAHHSSLPQVFIFPFPGINFKGQKHEMPPLVISKISGPTPNPIMNTSAPKLCSTIPPSSGFSLTLANNEVVIETNVQDLEIFNVDDEINNPLPPHSIFFNAMSNVGTKLDPIKEESGNRLKSLDSASSGGSTTSSNKSNIQLINSISTPEPKTLNLLVNESSHIEIIPETEIPILVDAAIGENIFIQVQNENELEDIQGAAGLIEVLNDSFILENPTMDDDNQTTLDKILENAIAAGKECVLLDSAKMDIEISLGDSQCFAVGGIL